MTKPTYDALLVVSFGGPEGPEEVMPFLENVTRGRNIPRDRLLAVAEHYQHFGGVSPINAQNRALIEALRADFAAHDLRLPIYFGNRNWRPLLPDTLRQMADDGVRNAHAFFTTAYSSYSSCRQYRENIADAQAIVGERAPRIDKLRAGFNHPGFIDANTERVRDAIQQLPASERAAAPLIFTAHSIPSSMAAGCAYEAQLREVAQLVAANVGAANWRLAFQSRSGPPTQPWLEPDILDVLRELAASGGKSCVIAPIGFISDHMEVMYDLDCEARDLARELGINMVRAATVGTHPAFVGMIRELVLERLNPGEPRSQAGSMVICPDICPADCCPAPARVPARATGGK